MTKKEDPAPPTSLSGPPPASPAPPAPTRPRISLQFGPTPSPPGSRLKTGRK